MISFFKKEFFLPSKAPNWFPDKILQPVSVELFVSFSANANRSASGSVARIKSALLFFAVSIAQYNVSFPSSGFGYLTVENSGSGFFCASTEINGWKWNAANACSAYGWPTPWTGV
jgi:hypothetical protein